jgi:uncharacterized protein YfaS (alpha-2-macroglobulin family)
MPLVGSTGAPLAAGAYYLRIRSPEGPRADLLALITRARLTLQSSVPPAGATGADALVWATDIISGTPISELPVALYQSGTLIELGATDPSGLARFTRVAGAIRPELVAVADGGRSGAVSSAWGDAGAASRARPRLFLTTDRGAYRPGERIDLAGIVQASGAPSGTLALARDARIGVSVRAPSPTGRIYQEDLAIGETGVFSTGMRLAPGMPPGIYTAVATIDGASAQATFLVEPERTAPLDVAVHTPTDGPAAGATPLDVTVHTIAGLPVAGATISWTLDAERAPFPARDDYIFGDPEREPAAVAARSGTGQTSADGRFSLVISDTLAGDTPLRYRLRADATEPGERVAAAEGVFLVAPAPIYAGVRLPSRIFTAGNAGTLDLLATTPDGRPAAQVSLLVEIYRRTWQRAEEPGPDARPRTVWRPVDSLTLTLPAATDQDGAASLPLTLPGGGAYRIHVGTAADIKTVYSATTIWATAPGFTSWGDLPGDQPLLVADRDSYRPGDTATLLLAAPFPQSPVLITRAAADGLDAQARTIRAGEPFTLTIRPEDAPALALDVLLAGSPPPGPAAMAPPPPLVASATLPVRVDQGDLTVELLSDSDSYAPGATATLTVTTVDATGVGVPADLILSVAEAGAAPQNTIAAAPQNATARPALAIAPRRAAPAPAALAAPSASSAPPSHPAPRVFWSSALRTSAEGVLTFTVRLPSEPSRLRALAWAAGADGAGQAQATLLITRPFELRVEAPQGYRAGDTVELAARVQSTSPVTQTIQASLSAAGLRLPGGVALNQQLTLAPGAGARFSWRAEVLDVAGVSLNITASAPDGAAQSAQIERPTLPDDTAEQRSGGIALVRDYLDPLTGQPLDLARLRIGQLVRARLTVVTAEARRLVEIADPLPANAVLVDTETSAGFTSDGVSDGRITLFSATLDPGIYQYSYLLRVAAGGRYGVPAPTATAKDGASGAGNSVTLDVVARDR